MNFDLPILSQDMEPGMWPPAVKDEFFPHEATTPQTCSFDTQLLTPPNSSASVPTALPGSAPAVEALALMSPETDAGLKASPAQNMPMPLPVHFVVPGQAHSMQQYQPPLPTPTHPQQYYPSYPYPMVPGTNPAPAHALPLPSLLVSPVSDYLHPVYAPAPVLSAPPQYYGPSYLQYHQQYHQQQYQNSRKGHAAAQSTRDHEQLQKELALRKASAEELQQVKFVKLTPMTRARIEQIKALAQAKSILPSVVESVLLLYTPEGRENFFKENRHVRDDMSKLEGNDIYIKITVNGGGIEDAEQVQQAQQVQQVSPPATASDCYYSAASYAASQACRSGRRSRKSKTGHVKRPLNSFMLYRKSQTQSAMSYAVHTQLKLNHQNISQIVGLMWQTESKEVKEQFTSFASREKEIHRVLHPDYKFCPQKKKKKRVY